MVPKEGQAPHVRQWIFSTPPQPPAGLEQIVIATLTNTRRFPNHGFQFQRTITARDCPTLMLAGSFLADASTGQFRFAVDIAQPKWLSSGRRNSK